jgi:hypothetical protein
MDIKITSLETILGRSVQVDDIKERLSSKFRDVQGCLSTA